MSKWVLALSIGGTTLLAAVALLRAWPVINVVETGRTPEYQDLQPRQYPSRKDWVFDAALRAVGRLPRWTVAAFWPEASEIRAEATTPVFRFVDDVTIRLEERDGATVVHVRSASRVGRGDFGQNARNVRAFLAELDREMAGGAGRG